MSGKFDSFVVFAEMRTGSNFLEANLNAFTGIARWKHQDFTKNLEHLIQETVAYTMAALLQPES